MAHNNNLLLASLSPSDTAALQSQLKPVHLEQQRVLVEAGATLEAVYFPTSAVVSIVVSLSTGELVEAAMVGRDGLIGAGAALDGNISLSRAIVQLAGDAMMCSLEDLRSAAMQSQSLLSKLIRHEQTVTAQSQQSAACIASHHTNARLCRWLLR
jgi:CRP-like cAMP-binding protein